MKYAGCEMNFLFFSKKVIFLKFQLQYNMSLSTWDKNFLSFVKLAMTTWQQFYISFIG